MGKNLDIHHLNKPHRKTSKIYTDCSALSS